MSSSPPPPAINPVAAATGSIRVSTDDGRTPLKHTLLRVLTRESNAAPDDAAPAKDDSAEHVGPPPPSPPASGDAHSLLEPADGLDIPRSSSPQPLSPEAPAPPSAWAPATRHANSDSAASVTFDLPAHPHVRAPSTPSRVGAAHTHSHQRHSASEHTGAPAPLDDSALSVSPRLARWNTTGGSAAPPSAPPASARSLSMVAPSELNAGEVPAALADDIAAQAHQIRRERHSKRLRGESGDAPAAGVAVGNVIGEGHANYVLMYNMLTGIRIAVSRCQAKITHAITEADFGAAHKYSFDIVGNELTPSAKYDFKFKDYAPFVFRDLRERHFLLDPADYLLSLTAKYILSELGSPGKSGSFFYFSRDYRFIIKTIRHTEHAFLRRILPAYYAHVSANPHTLLSRFYGLHRVKLPRGRKIHFVIMNNLFPAHKDVHETFDLKGSTVGRLYPEDKARANPRAVLKDLNWIARGKRIELGPEKRALLAEQLRRDADFLKEVGVMDYSLLIGIHKLERGNRDNVRRNTLKIFSPDVPASMRGADTRVLARTAPAAASLPDHLEDGPGAQSLFYQDEGGLRATDERNRASGTIYYLGVIDILTPFVLSKKVEGFWKGLRADRHKISPVAPDEYADRFVRFMRAVMRGGAGPAPFVAPADYGLIPPEDAPQEPTTPDGGVLTAIRSPPGPGAAGARAGVGGMREAREPGGDVDVAGVQMAAGAPDPIPERVSNGHANGHANGYAEAGESGEARAGESGEARAGAGREMNGASEDSAYTTARSGGNWKDDAQGPQRREFLRRWS